MDVDCDCDCEVRADKTALRRIPIAAVRICGKGESRMRSRRTERRRASSFSESMRAESTRNAMCLTEGSGCTEASEASAYRNVG